MTSLPTCPSSEDLRQFALGLSSDPDAQRLEDHLEGCGHCLVAISTLTARDALLETVRQHATEARREEDPAVALLIEQLAVRGAGGGAGRHDE